MQKRFQHLLLCTRTALHLACSMEMGIDGVCAKCVTYHVIKPSSCV